MTKPRRGTVENADLKKASQRIRTSDDLDLLRLILDDDSTLKGKVMRLIERNLGMSAEEVARTHAESKKRNK